MTHPHIGEVHRTRTGVAGWLLLVLLLGYLGLVHHGIGPVQDPLAFAWYQPRGFLFDWTSTDWLTEELRIGMVGFLLPALALAVPVWFTTRSALARLLAVWAVLGVGLCVYYGIEASGIWRFFHWRGSAVILLTALVVAVALTSPWLAASWERLPWPWRLVVYLPGALGAVAMLRNATGTDPALRFALSPWPVVPVFGLEWLVPMVCFPIACVALARAAASGLLERFLGLVSLVALALATLVLFGWWARDAGDDWQLTALAVCLAAAAFVWTLTRPAGAPAPGRHAALGVLLVAIPVLIGLAMAERDYAYTRDYRAARITAALAAYYEREATYPDRLEELVEAGLLDEVPVPRVGFRWIHQPRFTYQNFGINYLLEFSAPRWVQCAYNPPYLDEADEAEDVAPEDLLAEEDLTGSWSCPAKPPELW